MREWVVGTVGHGTSGPDGVETGPAGVGRRRSERASPECDAALAGMCGTAAKNDEMTRRALCGAVGLKGQNRALAERDRK